MKLNHAGILAFAFFLFVARSADATLIAVEDYESYAVSSALAGGNGGSGWLGSWSTGGTGSYTISNGGLNYSAGDISINGGNRAVRFEYSNDNIEVVANRSIAGQSTGLLYLSFLYRTEVDDEGLAASGNDFVQVGLHPTAGNPTMSVLDRNTTFQSRVGTGTNGESGISSDLGTTYLLVLKMENTTGGSAYDTANLFVNPTSLVEGANASTPVSATDVLDLSASAVVNFRRAFQEAGDAYTFDQLRVGTTFTDVVGPAIPEPGSLGLLGLGLVFLCRRFKR